MNDKANILVVDDERSVRIGVQRILSSEGYAAEAASTAEQALEKLSAEPFDLILTDLQMPGMDGLELLDEVKRRSPDTPVVMITAHGSMEVVIQALRRGVSDFVNKPFKPEELLNVVDREVARHQQQMASVGAPVSPLGLQLSAGQIDEIDRVLAELRGEISARCILVIEGNGHLIAAKGIIDDLNVSALATLVAGDFAATSGIASIVGEEDAFQMNYHEGRYYSVYSAHVAPDIFLLVVFGEGIKLGSVLYYADRALPKLKAIVEEGERVEKAAQQDAAASTQSTPVRDEPPSPQPAPSMPVQDLTAGEAASGSDELFSLDEIQDSDLLGDDALQALDEQFAGLWASD